MGRLLSIWFAFAAAFGMSGCLLFTDPMNQAPKVSIQAHTNPVIRTIPASFTATATDNEDSPNDLHLTWAIFAQANCTSITASTWTSSTVSVIGCDGSDCSYAFATLDDQCICAQATDRHGATGQACLPVTPVNPIPIAIIQDASGIYSDVLRPLYSTIHLTGAFLNLPLGDTATFSWFFQYTGTDSAGKSIQLGPCDGLPVDPTQANRCFDATSPGSYVVTLKVADVLTAANGATTETWSVLSDPFTVRINIDTPPCLQRTDPDVHAQRILLSHGTNLGGAYQSRTLRVLSVADDGNPYPVPPGEGKSAPQFFWSLYDGTQANPAWKRQPSNTSDSYLVSQSLFPSALPGDTVKVRIEVRDPAVQMNYQPPCPEDQDLCCDHNACGGASECVRWTTWTVQFQP